MEVKHIILAIEIIAMIIGISIIFTLPIFIQEINNFCQENGFDYAENYDSSNACWKDEATKFTVTKIKCDPDWVSVFTFRNPYMGCKFLKPVEVIN